MVYAQNILTPFAANPFNTGFSALFSECDLMRITIKEDDFLPFELVRKDRELYLHMIRSINSPLGQFEMFEMGGRMGEENVYAYLAVRKNQSKKSAYLLIAKPNDFGSRLLNQFKMALRKMLFFDHVVVQ